MLRSKVGGSGDNLADSCLLDDSELSKLRRMFIESCQAELGAVLLVVLGAEIALAGVSFWIWTSPS